MPKLIDLTGQTFGRLTVVEYHGIDKHRKAQWSCICSCGNSAIVGGRSLTTRNTQSCGCLKKEMLVARNNFGKGQISPNRTHNMSKSGEHNSWTLMKQRCTNPNNPNFKDYGERGIKMFEPWIESFEEFFSHVGKKPTKFHTIERINNDGGYFPGNVKWGTRKEQANNQRSNHMITFEGETMNMTQWAKHLGVTRGLLKDRIVKLGWGIEKALTQPVNHRKAPQSTIPRS